MILKTTKPFSNLWKLGFTREKETTPAEFIDARIPGAVQIDSARAHNYPNWFEKDNFRMFGWMEDVFWIYKTEFEHPNLIEGEELWFTSKGIDYEFEIRFNGKTLHYQEGMYTPVLINLTDGLQSANTLEVIVFPAPKLPNRDFGRWQADETCKPPSSYEWDWHPRLIPLGIWDETELIILPETNINRIDIEYHISSDLLVAEISASVCGQNLEGKEIRMALCDPDGEILIQETIILSENNYSVKWTIKQPRLWWPVGMGDQAMYWVKADVVDTAYDKELGDGQHISKRFGVRRSRLVMNQGAWDEPSGFPKSRSVPPITIEINNQRLFAKGTNWVQPEVFYGLLDHARYEELINLALEANFNILRMWGGGPVNKDVFFDLCDEKGIMVWQEFPLSCLAYDGDDKYLAVLKQEATSIINRLKHHASIVFWCGGNELFNNWSGMTDQSPALRLLNSLTYQLDPERPFIPTAPVMGMGHGHYVFRDQEIGEEVYEWMTRARNTAYSEFGVSGPADRETLESFIPKEELFPPKPDTSWETHHGFKSWQQDTWLMLPTLEHYFGKIDDLDDLIEKGQLLQGEGLKFIYEEARRQEPYCSMALNWCFNEPWPTAANNSILSWPAKPKPAFYQVKQACRTALTSARPVKLKWTAGEIFSAGLFFLSHFTEKDLVKISHTKLTIDVFIDYCTDTIHLLTWENVPVLAGKNVTGPEVKYLLPAWNCGRFRLLLKVKDHPEFNSEYKFLFAKISDYGELKNRNRLNM